jgi:hypothetical protein
MSPTSAHCAIGRFSKATRRTTCDALWHRNGHHGQRVASGLKLPYMGADRDLLEELVASRRLYSSKLFNGFTGYGVLEYLYLEEVTCIGKALIVGILLCLDIRLQNGAGTFDLFTY